MENLGRLVAELFAHVNPVLPVIRHVVAAEGNHRHRVAADNTHSAGRGSGGFGSHRGAYKHAVVPVAGLIHQRSGLGTAAAEDNRADRHAGGGVEFCGNAGAVLGGSGEAGVGMCQLVARGGVFHAVDLLALPLDSVDRRILVKTFPPDGVVVEVKRHIGKDGALAGRGEGVGVGLLVGAGRHAEEAVFGVDRPETSVGTDTQPADVVADTPDLVALLFINFGRNHHGKVGLAAGGGECRADILDLALGIFQTEDEHMLRHPAFLPALIGGNAQREALLAEQDVSAVSGIDRDDGVVLRELADISLLFVHIALGVKTLHPVGVLVAERVENCLAAAGHDCHVEHDID